jgi:aryl carrier-like protein
VAPSSPAEQALARLWSEVLEVDKVGVNDNFFELGGDSIRCITILSRAAQEGLHFSIEQIFQHPTVAGLAAAAQPGGRNQIPATQPFSLISAEDRAKLPPGIEDAYPLSRLQMGMFYANELDPVSAIYHDVFSYRINAGILCCAPRFISLVSISRCNWCTRRRTFLSRSRICVNCSLRNRTQSL